MTISMQIEPQITADDRDNPFLNWANILSWYRRPGDPAMSPIELALDYARRGWHVFPCSPINKQPMIKGGCNAATNDKALIRKLWRQHPTAMIGVACGEVSGIWCLDPDAPTDKNPIDGRESWTKLQADCGAAPDTHTHITPGGGNHLIFKWRPDRAPVTNREGALKGKHINVRGEGGYFIAAGSVNSEGIEYRVAEPLDYFNFAPAPDYLHDLIEAKAEQPELTISQQAAALVRVPEKAMNNTSFTEYADTIGGINGSGYAESGLRKEVDRLAATTTDRNIALNNAAISLGGLVKAGALVETDVIDALMRASDTNGLNKDDGRAATLATIKSGMGAATARKLPSRDEGCKSQAEAVAIPKQPSKGWPFKAAKDFRTAVNKDWIIKRVIAPNEVSNWCGPPGKGKSGLVSDLAMHVTAGIDWRGYKSKQQGGVIYFALERADLVERRWHAQAEQYGLDAGELPFYLVGRVIDMLHPSSVAEFVATIKAVEAVSVVPIKMIVIDTSAKAIAAGGGDENSAKDKNIMRANARRVMDACGGIHVALVSHTGKDVDKGERGSNAGLGDDDILIMLDGVTANVEKCNDGPQGALTTYSMKAVNLGYDDDGDEISIAIIAPLGYVASKDKRRDRRTLTPAQRLALTALERVITDEGKPRPQSSEYPAGVAKCATIAQWRKVHGAMSDSSKPDTVRKSFDRSREALQDRGWIGVWNDHVWIAYD